MSIYNKFFKKKSIVVDSTLKSIAIEQYLLKLLSSEKYKDERQLNNFERQSFSQYGEDGIVAEIFNRIGTTNKYFVEFGVESGVECNSILLLHQGWNGTWIEGNKNHVKRIAQRYKKSVERGALTILNAFITAENIEHLFEEGKVVKDLDFLSIDIDGNDYYIWEAIKKYSPRVVCVEYNAIFPPGTEFVIPYNNNYIWDGSSNFGSSLSSLTKLAASKNYSLVACTLSGVNAFFVRNDCLADKFIYPNDVAFHHEPARYYLYKKEGHPREISL